MPVGVPPASLPGTVDPTTIQDLRSQYPRALGHPRQLARFLCGMTSPAITKAKLSRHTLFGVWEDRMFKLVLEWVSEAENVF